MNYLNRKIASGAFWMGTLRLSVRFISLISTIILARLLVPADFGLVAMATSIVAMLELVTAFSFDVALIQKQHADRSHFDSAWTLNVTFHVALAILLVILAHPAAAFYQDARLESLIHVLAAGFMVRGFSNIGVVYFRKELDFRKDFILMLVKKAAGFAVVIPLAFLTGSYWALVVGIVIGDLFGVIFSYAIHPFRPRFSLAATGELFQFSKWLMMNNAINFLRMRSPDFVIGRLSGPIALGIFTIAHQLATLPSTELVAPINRILLPVYSKISDSPSELRKSYLNVLTIIAVVTLPASFGIAAAAVPLVDLLLGAKWASAAPIVSVLAVYGGLVALHSNTGSVFKAIGKPHLVTWIGSIKIVVLVAASIILGSLYGPMGVAVAYVGSTILETPLAFFYVCRETELRRVDLISALWRPMLSGVTMYAVLRAVDSVPAVSTELESWERVAILVPLGAILYVILSVGLWFVSGRPESADYQLAKVVLAKVRASSRKRRAPA